MNHSEIIEAFRKYGFSVWDTSSFGRGAPDLVVCKGNRCILVEVKHGKGTLTPAQREWHQRFPVQIVRSVEDVIAMGGDR